MTNIHINGGTINGMQVGDGTNNQNNTLNIGGEQVTVPQVFDALKAALPDIDAAADDDAATELEEMVVRPLQTLAELPEAELRKAETTEQAQSLLNQLVPFAPQIAKGLAVFGSAALSALASRNPVIAGVLAVCKMAGPPTSAD